MLNNFIERSDSLMNNYNRRLTKKDIEKIGKNVIGKTFRELSILRDEDLNKQNKGLLGLIIEEDVFEYSANSDNKPDFIDAGIELKVTPYKLNKNGTISAKERLVLNIINYMEEYKKTFYTSSFWVKNNTLYLMFYLHNFDDKYESKITNTIMFKYPEDDLEIIKKDWQIIIDKIKQGRAHELSESDTLYLGACTKGRDKHSLRKQPFSSILAKQRAYCLKTTYMTQIVREVVLGQKNEKLVTKEEIDSKSFEEALISRLDKYVGKTKTELIKMFNIESNSKNINEIILTKMLGVKGKLSKVDEFLKANIKFKTIRIEENGKIIESMSFPYFKFTDIVKEEWETSTLREMFETTKFLFVLFKKSRKDYKFMGVKLWNMPISILDNEVKKVWDKTVEIIKGGKIVKGIVKGRYLTNFPTKSFNNYCHVRPHARDINDLHLLLILNTVFG